MLPKPDRLDMLIFWFGVGADGIFVVTMTIMLAQQTTLEVAMLSGGALLAGRHVAGIIMEAAGIVADRVGAATAFAMSALLIGGLFAIGFGCLQLARLPSSSRAGPLASPFRPL